MSGIVLCRDCSDEGLCEAHTARVKETHEDLAVGCGRCARTGLFVVGMENGKPVTTGGSCFRCNGKGHHTRNDRRRNANYARYGMRV